jgi:hypothetical protein
MNMYTCIIIRNDRCQTAVLKFLIKLAPVLSEEHINKLLGELTKVFPDHPNADCKVSDTNYYSYCTINKK